MILKLQHIQLQLAQRLQTVELLMQNQPLATALICSMLVLTTGFATSYSAFQYLSPDRTAESPTAVTEDTGTTVGGLNEGVPSKPNGASDPAATTPSPTTGGSSGSTGSTATPGSAPQLPRPNYCSSFAAIGAPVQALSPSQKSAVSIGGWADISLGILKKGNDYQFYGVGRSRNSSTGEVEQRQIMTTGTLDNPVAKSVLVMPRITTASTGFQYLGGGPIYLDKDSQMLFQILHMERHYNGQNGSPQRTELHLGLINQTTNTTTDLGAILHPNFSYQTGLDVYNAGKRANADMGSPSIVNPGDGYLYVYYQDYYFDAITGSIRPRPMSVARAKLVDVVAAARSGTTTPWYKYYQSAWSKPGAGGLSTSLSSETGHWPFVSRSTTFGGYVVVSPNATSKFIIASSANGVTWNAAQTILEVDSTKYFIAYPSIVGTGSDPSDPGMDFYFFYLRWGLVGGARDWNDASIMRQQVRCTATR